MNNLYHSGIFLLYDYAWNCTDIYWGIFSWFGWPSCIFMNSHRWYRILNGFNLNAVPLFPTLCQMWNSLLHLTFYSILVWKEVGGGHKTKSEIGELLVNKFSREIHFSNKSFGNNHQEISRKVAGATNLYLKRNLKFSKIKKSLFHSHISKTLFNF